MSAASQQKLLIGAALFAAGLCSLVSVLFVLEVLGEWLLMPIWIGGLALIGAGVMTPFNRPYLGAVVAPVIYLVALTIFYLAVGR